MLFPFSSSFQAFIKKQSKCNRWKTKAVFESLVLFSEKTWFTSRKCIFKIYKSGTLIWKCPYMVWYTICLAKYYFFLSHMYCNWKLDAVATHQMMHAHLHIQLQLEVTWKLPIRSNHSSTSILPSVCWHAIHCPHLRFWLWVGEAFQSDYIRRRETIPPAVVVHFDIIIRSHDHAHDAISLTCNS